MKTPVGATIRRSGFPSELFPAFKKLNIGGTGNAGYGCRGGSLPGLTAMEMARVDCSISGFFGIHNGMAMGSIYAAGSEEQKQKWLPPMARFDRIEAASPLSLGDEGTDLPRRLPRTQQRYTPVEEKPVIVRMASGE